MLRQYLITKELNGYDHDKAGLLAKLNELEQSVSHLATVAACGVSRENIAPARKRG